MKKLLCAALFAASALGFSQSNEKGTIHVNVLGGMSFGSVKDEANGAEQKSTFGSASYGAKFQYGLADNISAGVSIRYGAYALTPKDIVNSNNLSSTMTALNAGLEGRYYVVNNDNFNFFAGPTVGFTTANNDFAGVGFAQAVEQKFSGLNFGLNTGINWYFTDMFGGTVQASYDQNMLSGETKSGSTTVDTDRNFGGVSIMAGLAMKF